MSNISQAYARSSPLFYFVVAWFLLDCIRILNSSPRWTKWPPFHRRHFQISFWWMSFFYFDSNLSEVCFQRFNWQQDSIVSVYVMAPERRQAITWTHADPVHRRIYAALGETWVRYHFSDIRPIHRSLVDFPNKGPVRSFIVSLNKP